MTEFSHSHCHGSDLRNKELTGGQFSARHLHLAVTLHLQPLQLSTALHHRLHFWLDLANVEPGNSKFLLNGSTDLHWLRIQKWDGSISRREIWGQYQCISRRYNSILDIAIQPGGPWKSNLPQILVPYWRQATFPWPTRHLQIESV